MVLEIEEAPFLCLSSAPINHRHVLFLATKFYSTGLRVCGQDLDSIISQTAGWQPLFDLPPSLTSP